eukprot:7335532-Alexandrium_andersonii.AAC.1
MRVASLPKIEKRTEGRRSTELGRNKYQTRFQLFFYRKSLGCSKCEIQGKWEQRQDSMGNQQGLLRDISACAHASAQ